MFIFYLKLGVQHILDIQGYDHILFIAAMVAVYTWTELKHVIVLVTAFTIGHSTTLALAFFDKLIFPAEIIEFLIALTIFITAFSNLFKANEIYSKKLQIYKYILAMFFGLIHGLGFSNYLRNLLGEDVNIVKFLLAFNLGLEVGQLIILLFVFMLNFILIKYLRVKQREWYLVISGMAIGISLILIVERIM